MLMLSSVFEGMLLWIMVLLHENDMIRDEF